jgi:hypothetical protein
MLTVGDRVMLRHGTPGERGKATRRLGTVREIARHGDLDTVYVLWDGCATVAGFHPSYLIPPDDGRDWPRDSAPDVERIPGTPPATLPRSPLRPSTPQARVVDLPLFGDREATLERAQLELGDCIDPQPARPG